MDDDVPVHSARIVKDWMLGSNIFNPTWPAHSPDLNPIENFWPYMKRRFGEIGGHVNNVEDLKPLTDQIWHSMEPEFISTYIDSMNDRLGAVRRAKGYYISY